MLSTYLTRRKGESPTYLAGRKGRTTVLGPEEGAGEQFLAFSGLSPLP